MNGSVGKLVRRALMVVLFASVMFTVLPAAETVSDKAAGDFVVYAYSQGGVYRKLISLQQKFPQGKYWNHVVPASEAGVNCTNEVYADFVTNTPCAVHGANVGAGAYDCNYFDGGLQCCGFARKVFYDIFGIRESTLESRAVRGSAGLCVGDFVAFAGFEHYAIVLSISGSSFTVAECNLDGHGPQYNCIINWGGVYQLSQIRYHVHSTNYDQIDSTCDVHTKDNGRVIKKAKHTKKKLADGKIEYTCTICGETWTEVIKASHNYKNKGVKKATLKKNGYIKQKCSKCGKVRKKGILRPKVIKLEATTFQYTGEAIRPEVIVKNIKGNDIPRQYYSLRYSSNKNGGTAKVKVKFKKYYSGSKTLKFTIYDKNSFKTDYKLITKTPQKIKGYYYKLVDYNKVARSKKRNSGYKKVIKKDLRNNNHFTNGKYIYTIDRSYRSKNYDYLLRYSANGKKCKKIKKLSVRKAEDGWIGGWTISLIKGRYMLLTKYGGPDWRYYTYRYDIKKKKLKKLMSDCDLSYTDYDVSSYRSGRSGRYILGQRYAHSDSSNEGLDLYEVSDSLQLKKILSLGDNACATFKGDRLYYVSFDLDYEDYVSGDVYTCCRDGSEHTWLGSFYYDYDVGYPSVYSFNEDSCTISFTYSDVLYGVFDYDTGEIGELVDWYSYNGYDDDDWDDWDDDEW